MNIQTIKRPAKRISVRYISNLGIKAYGEDNLYPQNVADVMAASSTGKPCLNRYVRFIEGNGLKDFDFAAYTVNRAGETVDDITKLITKDIGTYGGFALHVNYDVFGNIVELQHEPFENCRLAEPDDSGFTSEIITHPDWSGRTTRGGKLLKVNAETIERFPVFNPRKEVIIKQIESVGGIENYKGQILWVSLDGKFVYPIPKYDCALLEISSDEGLSVVKYRNTRNNFLPSGIAVGLNSQAKPNSSNHDEDNFDEQNSGFMESLEEFQGDENACSIMGLTVDSMEEVPQFIDFPTKNFDKDFSVTETSVIERIYSVFEQEIFHAIRIGKLGFSGNVICDAYDYYASLVNSEQRIIERAFKSIFEHWFEDVNPSKDFSIDPLKLNRNAVDNAK